MILSTQTAHICGKLGIEKTVEILKNAGFDAIDYSFFAMANSNDVLNSDKYLFEVEKIKNASDKHGIGFNQAHAPFATRDWTMDNIDEWFPKVTRSMEIASMIGARNIVVHPIHNLDYAEFADTSRRYNMDFYRRLLPYCEKYNICVCLENMWQRDVKRGYITVDVCANAEEFASYIDELNSPYLRACLDLGHCGLSGFEAQDAIRTLGNERLVALHVHDNDYKSDTHTLPYSGNMNWDEITKALADINYKGDFTFEADHFLDNYDVEFLPEACAYMAKMGRFLISKIENSK